MALLSKALNRIGLVTKADAQVTLNAAREEVASRGDQPLRVYGAGQRPGGVPYSILRAYARQCEPVRLCLVKVKQMILALDWRIDPRDEDRVDEAQLAVGQEWFSTSGGVGSPGIRVTQLIGELIEDLLVCGSVALYKRPTVGRVAGLTTALASIEALDTSKIVPLRDAKGWIPEPPATAYEQVLTNGHRHPFTRDELRYAILYARTYSANGESLVEDCLLSQTQFLAADMWNLQWFMESDRAPGYWTFSGEKLTPEEITSFRKYLEMQRKRGRQEALTPPAGWAFHAFTPRGEADYIATQRFLYQRIVPFFGLTPSAVGLESDTYKASQETQLKSAVMSGQVPITSFLEGLFTDVLQEDLGLTETQFVFDLDLSNKTEIATMLAAAGTERVSVNEGRELLGLPPREGGYANDLFAMTPLGPVVLVSDENPVGGGLDAQYVSDAGGSPAATVGGEGGAGGDTGGDIAKASRDDAHADLRRWRDKARKAAKTGKPQGVRFVSETIPELVSKAIGEQLRAGGDPTTVFAPYLEPDGPEPGAAQLAAGLEWLAGAVETELGERGEQDD